MTEKQEIPAFAGMTKMNGNDNIAS